MPEEGKTRRIPTFSAKLSDGSLVEMLLRKKQSEARLLVFRDGKAHEEERIPVTPGKVLMPYRPDNNLLTHGVVLLPSGLSEYESEEALFSKVRDFIHQYVDVPETFELVSAQYVFLTWVYDAFNELPYVRVRGDYGSGKSRYLQTVGSICYKPMFASGASTISPLFRILDEVRGTLIIDEGDFRVSDEKAEIVKILNNGNAKGFPLLRSEQTPQKEFNPRAFTVFGPKLVATRRHFHDQALESRCLTEDLGTRPLRRDIPITLPSSFHEEAEGLRNKLLCYRFRNLGKLGARRTIEGLEPRLSQILLPLLSSAVTEEAREAISSMAGGLSKRLGAERTFSLEGEVLEVIWKLRQARQKLLVKTIAEELSAVLKEGVTPRRVGALLRSRLFLEPVKRRGVYLLPETESEKLIALFERYRIGKAESETTGAKNQTVG